MDPSQHPANLVELLSAEHPLDPAMMRSHLPSWVDADIRQTLEGMLKEAPTGPATAGPTTYQQMLADMAKQVRSKQYDIQHVQQRQQQHEEPLEQKYPSPPSARGHPHRQSRDDSTLASSSSRHHAGSKPVYTVPSSLSRSHGATGRGRPLSSSLARIPSRSPPSSSLRASKSFTASQQLHSHHGHRHEHGHGHGHGSSRHSSSSSAYVAPPSPPRSPAHHHHHSHSRSSSSLASPRGPSKTVGDGDSSSGGPPPPPPQPDSVLVPLAWFQDMETKLQTLAQMGGPATEQMSKAAELQRLKYAMLITKLEEMNRLHQQVLYEEQQKQHLADLERVQALHMREFQVRLDAARAENARLVAEHESERTMLMQQREQERSLIDRWSADKDTQLDSLRAHFLEREKLLMEQHRGAEHNFMELREKFEKTQMDEVESRDKERREWDATRADYQRQVSSLLAEKTTLAEQLARKTLEAESSHRELLLLTEENTRAKARWTEAAARLAEFDSLQSKVHRLQAELSQGEQERQAKERHLQEQREELALHEERLKRLRSELDHREEQRREQRRRERRHVSDHLGTLDPPGGLHRFRADDLDCAWASGPIDRSLLQPPKQTSSS